MKYRFCVTVTVLLVFGFGEIAYGRTFGIGERLGAVLFGRSGERVALLGVVGFHSVSKHFF